MRRLFLDANVLFTAAHNPDGKAALLLALGREGVWELRTSSFAMEEARRNIDVKYPVLSEQFEQLMAALSVTAEQPAAPFPAGLMEKDRPIFQAALSCGATHLITGDAAHFGKFMMKPDKTFGILVMTPARFPDEL